MSTFVSNRDAGASTDENGHMRFPLKIWEGHILSGFEVTQNASPNMTVTITEGDARIPYNDYSYGVWMDADVTGVTVDTADATYNRIDRVVAYVDRGMSFSDTDINNPGALKFSAVAGTPAATPVAPNNTVVQNDVGVGNPWIELAQILVPANSTDVVNNRITDLRTPLKSLALAQSMYPIGSVYINADDDTDPNELLGFGTWSQFASGRVLVGVDAGQSEFNSLGETGGEKTHTLTAGEIPAHQHSGSTSTNGDHNHGVSWVGTSGAGYGWRDASNARSSGFANTSINGAHNHSFTTNPAGGGGAHNNLQPYITVYMWRRTL